MSRQKMKFKGLGQENVLGVFIVIRSFADLRDLAEVSVATPYQGNGLGDSQGYQRDLDEAYIAGIKRFLQKGRYRFFPMGEAASGSSSVQALIGVIACNRYAPVGRCGRNSLQGRRFANDCLISRIVA